MAKRITVVITIEDYPYNARDKIRRAMINAAAAEATVAGANITSIEAKVGTPHKAKP